MLELFSMVSLERVFCVVQAIRYSPMGFRPSHPLLLWLKQSFIETFGYQQGKCSFYTCSIETLRSQQAWKGYAVVFKQFLKGFTHV